MNNRHSQLDRLPPQARPKLSAIMHAADEAKALAAHTVKRISELSAAIGSGAASEGEAGLMTEELARLRESLDTRQARVHATSALASSVVGFINSLPPNVALDPAKVIRPKVQDGETVRAAVERIREEIAECISDQMVTKAAPPPKADLRKQAKAHVQALADKARPGVHVDGRSGSLIVRWMQSEAIQGARVKADEVAGLLAAVLPAEMTRLLIAQVDALAEPRLSLTRDQKAERLAEIAARLDGLEREEEALIELASRDGVEIMRRPEASGYAILGLVLRREAKAA
jgi:hypothetical protein